MAFTRRNFLVGIGGAIVGLPFLEGLASKERTARADAPAAVPSYALFYRRGNGVQQATYSRNSYPTASSPPRYWTQQDPQETERWWPMANASTPIPFGALATFGPISAMNELESYVSKCTVIRGL